MNKCFRSIKKFMFLGIFLYAFNTCFLAQASNKNYSLPLFCMSVASSFVISKTVWGLNDMTGLLDNENQSEYFFPTAIALTANPMLMEWINVYVSKRDFFSCSRLEIVGILVGTMLGTAAGLRTTIRPLNKLQQYIKNIFTAKKA